MPQKITKKDLSIIKRAKSFTHAGRGVAVFFTTTPNAWVHVAATLLCLFLGIYFSITSTEWLFIILAIGLVFTAEAFNTAIEIDIDLTSPEYHPHARDTKDVAAGAVLISSVVALLVGVVIFGPYLWEVLF